MRPSSNSQPVFPARTDSKIDSGLDADPSQKETVEFYRRLPTHKFSQRALHPGPAGPAGPSDLDKSCEKAGHRQTLLANLEQPICAQPARPMTTALHTAYPGGSSPGRFSLHVRSRGICCCARIAGIEGCTAEQSLGGPCPQPSVHTSRPRLSQGQPTPVHHVASASSCPLQLCPLQQPTISAELLPIFPSPAPQSRIRMRRLPHAGTDPTSTHSVYSPSVPLPWPAFSVLFHPRTLYACLQWPSRSTIVVAL